MLFALCLVPLNARAAVTLTTLHSFTGLEDGGTPMGLIQAVDGGFYGTTDGETLATTNAPFGTVFRITPGGAFTNLHVFSGRTGDGAWPLGGLAQDDVGNLYGTTYNRGGNGSGTVFKITPSGDFTTLVALDGFAGHPQSLLVRANNANFYTFGNHGGALSLGTLFSVTPDGTVAVVVEFGGVGGFTGWSSNPLLQGADGNFYGATLLGGPTFIGKISLNIGYGTLFKMTPNGTLNTLVEFNGTNGYVPSALVQGADGNLYGTTSKGGPDFRDGSGGDGTVFKLTTNGLFTTLAMFNRTNGNDPRSLILARDRNFYGVTAYGGIDGRSGTIFKMTPDGELTSLFSFNGTNGAIPLAGSLVQAADGTFYGTTYTGGASNVGTIFHFEITPDPPRLENISQNGSGGLTFSWIALPGRSYQVQFNGDLTQSNWTKAGDPITATNTSGSASDLIGPDRQRFYRVVLLP
jgi:uncharacterized repeat protein (TIGR03803 family)